MRFGRMTLWQWGVGAWCKEESPAAHAGQFEQLERQGMSGLGSGRGVGGRGPGKEVLAQSVERGSSLSIARGVVVEGVAVWGTSLPSQPLLCCVLRARAREQPTHRSGWDG